MMKKKSDSPKRNDFSPKGKTKYNQVIFGNSEMKSQFGLELNYWFTLPSEKRLFF